MSLADRLTIHHTARVLTIDIETFPNVVPKFDLRSKMPTSIEHVIEWGGMACFAAKWRDRPEVMFWSTHRHGHDRMVQASWDLCDAADIVVTYNGGGNKGGFDIPKMQWEWMKAGFPRPRPFKSLDLYKVAKQFGSPSRKLDFFAHQLGIGAKVEHAGMALWLACMRGEPEAWKQMRIYNAEDVRLTERLHDRWLPWLDGQANVALWTDDELACPSCGSSNRSEIGTVTAVQLTYATWRCADCGLVFRANYVKRRALSRRAV